MDAEILVFQGASPCRISTSRSCDRLLSSVDVVAVPRLSGLPTVLAGTPCVIRPDRRPLRSLRFQAIAARRFQVSANHAPTAASRYINTDSPLFAPSRSRSRSVRASPVSFFTPCPLRDQTVDHHEPDRFSMGVLRSRPPLPWGRDEPEIALAMRLELRFARLRQW